MSQITPASLPETVALHHLDFRTLQIRSGSIHLGLTDVEWSPKAARDWYDLGKWMVKRLAPEGLFCTLIGQRSLHSCAAALTEAGLHWQLQIILNFPKGCHMRENDGVISSYPPVIAFSKQKTHTFRLMPDQFEAGEAEKDWHPWQQPVPGFRSLVEHLSEPGDLVVDPCMGTGTTGLACMTAAGGPRRFVGCDRDAKMYKIAQHRIGHVDDESVAS